MTHGRPFVAIIGLHGSGSSCLAGVVHHLGIHLGNKLGGYYGRDPHNSCGFEAEGLSRICCRAARFYAPTYTMGAEDIRRQLQTWIQDRQREAEARGTIAGGKYPELTLLHDQCLSICGSGLNLIVSERPLEESIASMIRREQGKVLPEFIETRQRWLWREKEVFRQKIPDHLTVWYHELLADPPGQVDRIVDYLGINPSAEQIARAIAWVQPDKRNIFRENAQ